MGRSLYRQTVIRPDKSIRSRENKVRPWIQISFRKSFQTVPIILEKYYGTSDKSVME